MRFAKLCVLEIGKNAGRVELVGFLVGKALVDNLVDRLGK